jgi:hypothetical protein
MKERIRQIVREETSGLDPKVISAAYKMMDNLTKDYLWYFDTPERRFKYTSESIWLINPNTKNWVLEFDKSGKLLYYYEIYLTFRKYFNMEFSDFESFIKLWVEDALKRGVSTTKFQVNAWADQVEDALKRGVSTTRCKYCRLRSTGVEDALKRGVSTTLPVMGVIPKMVDDILKKGKELK